MIAQIIAHAGEAHESAVEATAHSLAWYVQLPLFLLAMVGFMAILWVLTKKAELTVLITATVLLVAGFSLFRLAPVVSATAITLGLVATLFTTLVGLGNSPHKKAD